jgi:hypothetical protein
MVKVTGKRCKALLHEGCFLSQCNNPPPPSFAINRNFRDEPLPWEVIPQRWTSQKHVRHFLASHYLPNCDLEADYNQKNKSPFALLRSLIQMSLGSWGNEPLNYILQRKAQANSLPPPNFMKKRGGRKWGSCKVTVMMHLLLSICPE